MKKKCLAASLLALLLVLLCAPLTVHAATEYSSVAITVNLERDGSALVTEVWDMSADEGTEMYLERVNFDEQTLSGFAVFEDGQPFENVGEWDVNASFDEKAGKCGMVMRSDGYELCWGLGSYGRHKFTVQYRLTNMVKHYNDAEVIYQVFLRNFSGDIGRVDITIKADGQTFTTQNTGVWAGGTEGEIWVRDGEVQAYTTQNFPQGNYFGVLVQFAEGMFSPAVARDENFEDLKARVLEGSSYVQDGPAAPGANEADPGQDGAGQDDEFAVYFKRFGNIFGGFGNIFGLVFPLLVMGGVAAIVAAAVGRGKGGVFSLRSMKPEYRDAPYSRELPWGGSLPATYTRLEELHQLQNEGDIIGAYLLRWIRSRQVELVKHQQNGFFSSKEEDAIKLYAARPDMPPEEWELYGMLMAAAGADQILQSKEFEKWSRKRYEQVEGWLEHCKSEGKAHMRAMGALVDVPAKVFFGLVNTTRSVMSPEGERLTQGMFGFKKYLKDFTIINERQAREVQLWDEYLVFAQMFGMADEVAGQFEQLYPDYFTQMARDLGYTNLSYFDFYMLSRIARGYGHAAYSGYRAGYNAAHSGTAFGGGGGGFSGGGGGFSGGSGGGGGGVR